MAKIKKLHLTLPLSTTPNQEETKLPQHCGGPDSGMTAPPPGEQTMSLFNDMTQGQQGNKTKKKNDGVKKKRAGDAVKRLPGEKVKPRKRKSKEEKELAAAMSSTEAIMGLLRQLPPMSLREPDIPVNYSLYAPYGSGSNFRQQILTGSFGNAHIPGVPDYYTQLMNGEPALSNPPTPPASLPPTPPPFLNGHQLAGGGVSNVTPDSLEKGEDHVLAGMGDMIKAGMRGVIIPPSLPTPPHTSCDETRDPPDYLPSSSPEPDIDEEIPTYPALLCVDSALRQSQTPSPVMPLITPVNNHTGIPHADNLIQGSVPSTVTMTTCASSVCDEETDGSDITLILPNDSAGEIQQMMRRVSDLLNTLVPQSYNVSVNGSFITINCVNDASGKNTPQTKQSFCRHCDVVVFGQGIRKISSSDLDPLTTHPLILSCDARDHPDEQLVFCSNNCYIQFAITHKTPLLDSKVGDRGVSGQEQTLPPGSDKGMARPNTFASYALTRQPPANETLIKIKDLEEKAREEIRHQGVPDKDVYENELLQHARKQENVDKIIEAVIAGSCDSDETGGGDSTPLEPTPETSFIVAGPQTSDNEPAESNEPTTAASDQPDPLTTEEAPETVADLDAERLSSVATPSSGAEEGLMSVKQEPGVSLLAVVEETRDGRGSDLQGERNDKPSIKIKIKKRPSTEKSEGSPPVKKWKGIRWKMWHLPGQQRRQMEPPSSPDIDDLVMKLGTCIRPEATPNDRRRCLLCQKTGDGETEGPSRLLNYDVDTWVHLNCALWSTEVYEMLNGALMHVQQAVARGQAIECSICTKAGATLSCTKSRCPNTYHFNCAAKGGCMFFKDKTILCPLHKPNKPHENELLSYAVFRKVYIHREEHKQVASIMQHSDRRYSLRIGSLIFHSIGQLLPHQMPAFHTATSIYPIGFETSRYYWSMRYTNKRCQYVCGVSEVLSKPEFTIRVEEPGHDDIILTDLTPKGVWQKVLVAISKLRNDLDMLKIFPRHISGEDLYGLAEPAILRVIESLPGIDACETYKFRYGKSPIVMLPLAINPTGCARSEPKMRTHFKRPHTLTSSNTRTPFPSTVGIDAAHSPYLKQFVHSKSSQYRRMKLDWRNNVYLARSNIQGLGLYAARDLEKHTMCIEYIGSTIRNEVANQRERIYESANRGVYMFRLTADVVVDATCEGGLARYINHSCSPNCVAEIVTIDRDEKIIIISNRRLSKGEELTYDYKFEVEDDQNKIPCLCHSHNCVQWMN